MKHVLSTVAMLVLVIVCYQDAVRGYWGGSGYGGYWAWSYGYWWQDPYGYYYEPPLRAHYYEHMGSDYQTPKVIKKHNECDCECALRCHD